MLRDGPRSDDRWVLLQLSFIIFVQMSPFAGGMFGGSKSLGWSKYGNLSGLSKKIFENSASETKSSKNTASTSKKEEKKEEDTQEKKSNDDKIEAVVKEPNNLETTEKQGLDKFKRKPHKASQQV